MKTVQAFKNSLGKSSLGSVLKSLRRNPSNPELTLEQKLEGDAATVATRFDVELLKTQAPDDFLDILRMPWVAEIEADTTAIEQETANLLKAIDLVPPFGEIQESQRTLSGTGWRIFPFLVYGHRVDWAHKVFPATSEIISRIPDCMTAMFSILQPGQHLHPHIGPNSAVLRYHLSTYNPEPEKCAIRVADKVRHWELGKSLVLNDYREHEAWNSGEKPRVVLFVDFKRPVPKSLEAHRDAVIERFAEDNFSYDILNNFNQWVDVYGNQIMGQITAASTVTPMHGRSTAKTESEQLATA